MTPTLLKISGAPGTSMCHRITASSMVMVTARSPTSSASRTAVPQKGQACQAGSSSFSHAAQTDFCVSGCVHWGQTFHRAWISALQLGQFMFM